MTADRPALYVGRRRGSSSSYRSVIVYHAADCANAPEPGAGVFRAWHLPAPESRAACCLERGVTLADGAAPRDVQYGRDRYPGVT